MITTVKVKIVQYWSMQLRFSSWNFHLLSFYYTLQLCFWNFVVVQFHLYYHLETIIYCKFVPWTDTARMEKMSNQLADATLHSFGQHCILPFPFWKCVQLDWSLNHRLKQPQNFKQPLNKKHWDKVAMYNRGLKCSNKRF